ncbi:hypothetical protein H6G64_34125 [Calothrix sp. FACHB-156]|nr:hypothetical protein [Calothrix sp. FACHB-156]
MKNNQDNYVGENPNLTDDFWLNVLQHRATNSIQLLEDTAKQYITITSFSQTVYFAAISFAEVKKSLVLFPSDIRLAIILLLTIPLICWVYALISATRAFAYKIFKTNIQSPRAAKEFYRKVLNHKSLLLKNAFWSLILGFIFLIINLIFYLEYFPLVKDK